MQRSTTSHWFRAVAVAMAIVIAIPAVAQGVFDASRAAWVALKLSDNDRNDPRRARYNVRAFRGGFDAERERWWTPALRANLRMAMLERGASDVGLYALVAPDSALALLSGPGNEGSGGGGPGEGTGPGGGSGGGAEDDGVNGPGDGPDSGGSGNGGADQGNAGAGGLGGTVNTNTGNKLTVLPVAGFGMRGDAAVDFRLYHNSVGSHSEDVGKGWSHSYSMWIHHTPNESAIVRHPDGFFVPYTESPAGTFAPPSGVYNTLTKTATGWNLVFRDRWRYTFNTAGDLVSIRSIQAHASNGLASIAITRDAQQRVTEVSANDGRKLTLNYGANDLLADVIDPLGRKWEFLHDAQGRLTRVDGPAVNGVKPQRHFTYGAGNNILTETDPEGHVWTWTYDAEERITSFKNPLNRTWSYAYLPNGVVELTTPASTLWTYFYSSGRLESIVERGTSIISWEYDANGHIERTTDGDGVVTEYQCDAEGRVTQITDAQNRIWRYGYGAYGRLAWAQDPTQTATERTTYFHDARGNLTRVRNALGLYVLDADYDAHDDLEWVEDGENRRTTYVHNAQGDVTQVTDPAGVDATASYDLAGRALWVRDNANHQTTYAYDAQDRVTSITHPDSSTETFTYDKNDRLLTHTDPLSRVSSWTYNAAGLLIERENPLGQTEQYGYDVENNVISVTNGNGKTRQYGRDAAGRLLTLTHADGAIEEWQYTIFGRPDVYIAPTGAITDYLYNARGLLQIVDLPAPMGTVEYGYDHAGRVQTITDATGVKTWTYDKAGQTTALSQPGISLEFQYDASGLITRQREVGSPHLDTLYVYDAAGRPQTVTNPLSEVATYAYDTLGRLQKRTLHSGAHETLGYDARSRLTSVTLRDSSNATLRSETWAFDVASQMSSHTVDGVATTYGHDAAGRLDWEERGTRRLEYDHDANGNRTFRRTLVGGVVVETDAYAYDDADKLLTIHRNGTLWRDYDYDGAGRTTQIWEAGLGTRTFAWNGDSRLTSITGAGGTRSYAYDGLGARVSATDSLGTRTFLRAGVGVTAPVLSDGQARYTPGVSERRGGATTYLHSGLKNAGAQSGAAQTLSGTRHYDAFGRAWPGSSSGTWQGPFAYAGAFGYQTEPDSGLKLLGNRYYDPETGRFLTRDPIKDGSNWYAYGGGSGSPVAFADPTGLIPLPLIAVAVVMVLSTQLGHTPQNQSELEPEFIDRAREGMVASNLEVAQAILDCATLRRPPPFFPGVRPGGIAPDVLRQAEARYPKKAGKYEDHHVVPHYLGGDGKGPTVRLPAAYHQLITNAFREEWAYGQNKKPTAEQLARIMERVYKRFPLPDR